MKIQSDITKEDLIQSITDYFEPDSFVEFIIRLDKEYGDWDVTETLARYFNEEIKRRIAEE